MLHGVIRPRGAMNKEIDQQSIERFRELEESIAKSSELRSENIEKIVAHIREFREKNEKIIENQLTFSDGVCVGVPVISNNMITDDDDIFKRAINIDKVNEIRPKN